jgi:uncharacterized glyoxalase superfamily protein PhnB
MDVMGSEHPTPPAPYRTVTPRMFVDDVEQAVAFLRSVFGATAEVGTGRPTDVHIGDSVILVSSAAERERFPAFLYVYVNDADAAHREAVRAGARTIEEPVDTPYGDRRCMFEDAFGNVYQVAHRR